jgi:hypothetical protein
MSDVPSQCYLTGYWQSEKYFSSVEAEIRKDFTFNKPLIDRNLELSAKMATCGSISLHIRRGDYVSDAQTSAILGVCPLDYYRNAVAYVADRVANPQFFVFSDDIEWARENLGLDHPSEYIDHNRGAESYCDMQLMSKCRHHIIANSSFSWWGAWLNPHADKIVVAPKRWFAGSLDSTDLVPQTWTRL